MFYILFLLRAHVRIRDQHDIAIDHKRSHRSQLWALIANNSVGYLLRVVESGYRE